MNSLSSKQPADKTNNHLANERTFLAWIRTSISIIVFGFVVAKFGIVLREFLITQSHSVKQSNTSMCIGVGFMIIGIVLALASMVRYRIVMHHIEENEFKPTSMIAIFLGIFTAAFGIVLVIYLMMTAQTL